MRSLHIYPNYLIAHSQFTDHDTTLLNNNTNTNPMVNHIIKQIVEYRDPQINKWKHSTYIQIF